MAKKPVGRGRPAVEVKKVPYTVMLDPRYLQDMRSTAADEHMDLQDYMRRALEAFFPNRYRSRAIPFEIPKVKAPKG